MLELTAEEERIRGSAIEYVREHRNEIAIRLTDPDIYHPEENPVSVFMAGSPGAGKTEASIELLKEKGGDGTKILRIDPDELRDRLPGYTGTNSWLFQSAVSLLVERIHDRALKNKQSFILDGTLSSYDVAEKNIKRSIGKSRTVQILYVYQEPRQAWEFVQLREALEGRRIEPEDFVNHYFGARKVVNQLKTKFGKEVQVDLLMKNNDGSRRFYRAGVDLIDNHIPEKYDVDDVRRILNAI